MAKVAEYKKKIVREIADSISKSRIIGAINVENLPAPQLQRIRAQLRGKVRLAMTKKRLIKLALEEAKKTKKGVEGLEQYLEGMPALIFTDDNPFKLFKLLQKNKSAAPAKAGQKAPKDIVIPKGPTSFAPGPIISELAQAGIKAGVDKGKVAVKEDSLVAKKGEPIKPKVADILIKLGIEPMEVGLDLVAVYEDGTVYNKDVLAVDEAELMGKLANAARCSFNLAMFIEYPAKDTITFLIGKAFNDAKALGISQEIIDEGIVDILMGKANQQMLSLKNIAHIEAIEKKGPKPHKDHKPHKEDKKEERIEQEKSILEEEKKIIEEEKELEKPQAVAEAPVEKEIREAAKEEEEKELEQERMRKEKAFEKMEKKEELLSVEQLVKQTKDFAAGKREPTADELLKEAEPKKEEKKKDDVPTAADLAAKKKKKEMEDAEQLFKKLQRKGTLR